VEELFLRAFLACKELNVIYHQNINTAVFVAKLNSRFETDRVYQLICELLTWNVHYFCEKG